VKKILLYNSGGGLGDSIQLIPIILSIKNHYSNSEIYYLTSHTNHFAGKLKDFNLNLEELKINLKYFGFRWWHYLYLKNQKLTKFDLIIDLQSKIRNTLILKQIPHSLFFSSTFNFYFSKNKDIKFNTSKNFVENTIANLSLYTGEKIKKIDFNLKSIPKNYMKIAEEILPDNNYVGFSLTQGNLYRKKSWPLANFISLAKKILLNNDKPVFFIENKYADLINKIKNEVPQAIFPEEQIKDPTPLMVTALATRLNNSITIDNGVMHMISLSKTPMIVLFGPTSSLKFAPKHDKIKIIDSKLIYDSNDITKLTVEDVLKNINN
tara:strand:+ start:408 stop:1373 length:966 start_codon:yes stop_codon:yes gene_type:complete